MNLEKQMLFESEFKAVMEDKCVSFFTKEIITKGLQKDCVDAVKYVEKALEILKLNMEANLGA